MTRRGFIKSLLALAASRAVPIPKEELRTAASLIGAGALPIGTIHWMYDAARRTVCVMVTDHGIVELEGGKLSAASCPKLFELIGTKFGGDEKVFNLPDMRAYRPAGG